MRFKILPVVALLCSVFSAYAQLSQGGRPLTIPQLKSTQSAAFVSLRVPQSELDAVRKSEAGGSATKAFRFAWAIPVDFSLSNAGQWYRVGSYRVWQLKLESAGAYSLNVIFRSYRLPEGARLFLFSEDRSDLLGAFTAANNPDNGIFAVLPVAGDRLVIQYEEPLNAAFAGELHLQSVNHDFKGIKAGSGGRRPLGESGTCNVNVNCDKLDQYRQAANAVCRILVAGTDLCTGTLLNNVRQDGTPYLITANHCITTAAKASASVFLFNYESPYCGNLDGEILNSISGSTFKAGTSDIDFTLVQLSSAPPQRFMPYYLGWDNSAQIPDSTVVIHHPLGDVKKVSVDRNQPAAASYTSDYLARAFWRVSNWEAGTTEAGSSGAALIDPKMRVRGTLTGGEATCAYPVNDYFAQFGFAWNYYAETGKQLKAWLDPDNSGNQVLAGVNPYRSSETCSLATNLTDADSHDSGLIDLANAGSGYFSGTNAFGFDGFAEGFNPGTASTVLGVSLGISKKSVASGSAFLRIGIYSGASSPETLLHAEDFALTGVDEGVMNYFGFGQPVSATGKFFVVWSLEGVGATDQLGVFLARRADPDQSSFQIRDGGSWYTFADKSLVSNGAAAVAEAVICRAQTDDDYNPFETEGVEAAAFPNPLASGTELTVWFDSDILPDVPLVYDLLGRQVPVGYTLTAGDRLTIRLDANPPGIYLVNVRSQADNRSYRFKISYLGNSGQ